MFLCVEWLMHQSAMVNIYYEKNVLRVINKNFSNKYNILKSC